LYKHSKLNVVAAMYKTDHNYSQEQYDQRIMSVKILKYHVKHMRC